MDKKTDRKKFLDSLDRYMIEMDAQPHVALLIPNQATAGLLIFKKFGFSNSDCAKLLRKCADSLEFGVNVEQQIPQDVKQLAKMQKIIKPGHND